jgi:microsomal dipeptidase-like Zn-dependent dipeptidase
MNSFNYPSISVTTDNNLEAFVIGSDSNLYQKSYRSNRWIGAWNVITNSDMMIPNSAISCTYFDIDTYLFFTGRDGNIYYRTLNNEAWTPLVSNCPPGSNIVVYNTGLNLVIACIDTTGTVKLKVYNRRSLWTEWFTLENLKTVQYGSINIIRFGKSGISPVYELYVVDTDGVIKYAKFTVNTTSINLLGIETVRAIGPAVKIPVGASIAVTSIAEGSMGVNINIFVVNNQGKIIRNRRRGTVWQDWITLEGKTFPVGSPINIALLPETNIILRLVYLVQLAAVDNVGKVCFANLNRTDGFQSVTWGNNDLLNNVGFAPGAPVSYAKNNYVLNNLDGYFFALGVGNSSLENIGKPLPNNLWGFAELHSHVASFLSFGANDVGDNGIFWGKPGMGLATSNLALDLPACDANIHSGWDGDVVRVEVRNTVIKGINGLSSQNHGKYGYPYFEDWPHALSVFHQQMHISWIKRAYDGGLRLMVASITDNQMLGKLWNWGFYWDPTNADRFPSPNYKNDYNIALKAIAFIRELATANSTWMEIVTDPLQARNAIRNNRMAIILGLELDNIKLEDTLDLCKNHGVRTVIPVHLANSCFGGTAIYNDLFNTNNHYINGSFLEVADNKKIEFRLQSPPKKLALKYIALAVSPDPEAKATDNEYNKVEYEKSETCTDSLMNRLAMPLGHINKVGLIHENVLELMSLGILVDMAHMSQKAMEGCSALLKRFRYPFMNTHTGLRDENVTCHGNERDMHVTIAREMGISGGVLGLGTSIGSGGSEPFYKLIYYQGGYDKEIYKIDGSNPSVLIDLSNSSYTIEAGINPNLVIRKLTFTLNLYGSPPSSRPAIREGYIKIKISRKFDTAVCGCSEKKEEIMSPINSDMLIRKDGYYEVNIGKVIDIPFYFKNIVSVEVISTTFPFPRFTQYVSIRANDTLLFSFTPPIRNIGGVFDRVKVTIKTGNDNLDEGSIVTLSLLNNDEPLTNENPISLNNLSEWKDSELRSFIIPLIREVSIDELTHIQIYGVKLDSHAPDGEGWKINSIKVEAILTGQDPLTGWLEADGSISTGWIGWLDNALNIMGGRGVSIGTDFNGFQANMPFTNILVDDVTVQDNYKSPSYPTQPVSIGLSYVGEKEFNINKDGLAHFGMIPDFFQAIHNSGNTQNLQKIYKSAEDVILMWEKCELAAKQITTAAKKDFIDNLNFSFNSVRVVLTTGGDNLRSDTRVYAKIGLTEPIGGSMFATMSTLTVSTNELSLVNHELQNFSRETALIYLENSIPLSKVKSFELFTRPARTGSLTSDNWNVDSLIVTFEYARINNPTLTNTVITKQGNPFLRFKGSTRNSWIYESFQKKILDTDIVTSYSLTIITGEDNREGGQDTSAYLKLKDGTKIVIPLGREVLPSDTTKIVNGSISILKKDITHLGIHTNMEGGLLGKNWDIAEIKLKLLLDDKEITVFHESGYAFVRLMGGGVREVEWELFSNA